MPTLRKNKMLAFLAAATLCCFALFLLGAVALSAGHFHHDADPACEVCLQIHHFFHVLRQLALGLAALLALGLAVCRALDFSQQAINQPAQTPVLLKVQINR